MHRRVSVAVLLCTCLFVSSCSSLWIDETLYLVERYRAVDGGYGYAPIVISAQNTYYLCRLRSAMGLTCSPRTKRFAESVLGKEIGDSVEVDWDIIDETYHYAGVVILAGDEPELSWSRKNLVERAALALIGQPPPADDVALHAVRVSSVICLLKWTASEGLAGLTSYALSLWSNDAFIESEKRYGLTGIDALTDALQICDIDLASLVKMGKRIEFLKRRVKEISDIKQEDWLIQVDVCAGASALCRLGAIPDIGDDYMVSLLSSQLPDGGFDFVNPFPPMDPRFTYSVMGLLRAVGKPYPHGNALSKTLGNAESLKGGVPYKVLITPNLDYAHKAAVIYAAMGRQPPDRERLTASICSMVTMAKADQTLVPVDLWLAVDALDLLGELRRLEFEPEFVEASPEISSYADLSQVLSLLRVAGSLQWVLPDAFCSTLIGAILVHQTKSGAFSFGGSELRDTFLAVQVLGLVGGLSDPIRDKIDTWLGTMSIDFLTLEGAYQLLKLYHDSGMNPPSHIGEWVRDQKNPGGGFGGDQLIEDVFWGVQAHKLARLRG